MSLYLKRLAERLVDAPAKIRPRLPSRFETPGGTGSAMTPSVAEAETARTDMPARAARAEAPEVEPPRTAGPDARPAAPVMARPVSPSTAGPADAGLVPIDSATSAAIGSPQRSSLAPPANMDVRRVIGEAHIESRPGPAAVGTADRTPLPLETRSSRETGSAPAESAAATRLEASPAGTPRTLGTLDAADRRAAPVRLSTVPALPSAIAEAVRRQDAFAASPAASPTVVQVTIGTVEVRAPAPPPRPQPVPRTSPGPRLGLQDYLTRRGQERQQ